MSETQEQIALQLSEQAWARLESLEGAHQQTLQNLDKARRVLNESIAAREEMTMRQAWEQYRAVVMDLDRATADIESLRLSSD